MSNSRDIVNAGNQRESQKRHVEMLSKELEDAKNEAESKTRECDSLLDER